MNIALPKGVAFIIQRMKSHGKRADIVGGCVRDTLLGRIPDDYDITTDATPEETKGIFSDFKVIETGISHGTVTLVLDGVPYEITTYRIESGYSDNRHPDKVEFTRRLADDLSRRDFTVNAMCYNPDYGVTDIFGGRTDLENRVIRAVGDAELRFSEDALRILRAIRFASTLDFEIEKATALAATKKRMLLMEVSSERIFTELKKLLEGKNAVRVLKEYADIITVFLPELKGLSDKLTDTPVSLSGIDTVISLSLLFVLCSESPETDYFSATDRLKTDNRFKKLGIEIIRGYKSDTDTDLALTRLLSSYGYETAEGILTLRHALGLDSVDRRERLSFLEKNSTYKVSQLKIGGNTLLAIGFKGASIGETLSRLLDSVIAGEVDNTENALSEYATEIYNSAQRS